ncbi:hypothetical protein O3800_02565 [Gemella sanguinis]|uniref:hypothetical protein n=1 Tax=Gemella sanguinis TaxID=84135 RepID=UPI00352E5B19
MNSNIDEKEAELRHNNRIARALLNKLYFNINDLKTWQELFDLVKKNPEIDDDFWWELCKLDFTKIKYFPIKSLLAGMLNLKKDDPNISKIFDYIYFENTVYLEKYEEKLKYNRIPSFIVFMAGTFGVAFFNAVNFILLFCAPLNFKEILFNLIVGCYLSGLVYEIIERQDLFKWEKPYFENSKFLMYKWAYIPIIIFYLYMNILLLYTQGANYNIEYKYKIFLTIYVVALFVCNSLFKLVNYSGFVYKFYVGLFKIILTLIWLSLICAYLFVNINYISLLVIIVTIIIFICFRSLKKVIIGRNLKLLFYPMTFFYLTYMIVLFAISLDFITTNYNIMGPFSILLYISGALAVVIKFFSSKSSVKF